MPLYDVFKAAQAQNLIPDVSADVIALYPEVMRAAPVIARIMQRNGWEETIQPEFTWNAVNLRARTTQINNGGTAYTNATTDLVVDDAAVFDVGSVVLAEATGERMYVTAVNIGSNTITVRRGIGTTGGSPAAHANSVVNDAVLRNIGVAAPPGGDKLPESFLADASRKNICQFFRKTVVEDGRLRASRKWTPDSLAAQTQLKYEEMLRDAEHAILFGTYIDAADSVLDASSRKITTTAGIVTKAGINIAVGGNITDALWKQYMRTVFSVGSQERVMYGGLEAIDWVLKLHGVYDQRDQSSDVAGQQIRVLRTQNGIVRVVPHLGFTGARAQNLLFVDELAAPPRLRHMGANRFKSGPGGAALDGKMQILDDRQGTSEDLFARELVADFGVEWGEGAFNAHLTGISGVA